MIPEGFIWSSRAGVDESVERFAASRTILWEVSPCGTGKQVSSKAKDREGRDRKAVQFKAPANGMPSGSFQPAMRPYVQTSFRSFVTARSSDLPRMWCGVRMWLTKLAARIGSLVFFTFLLIQQCSPAHSAAQFEGNRDVYNPHVGDPQGKRFSLWNMTFALVVGWFQLVNSRR